MSDKWKVVSRGGKVDKKTNLVLPANHTLTYDGVVVDKAKGVDGLRALTAQAEFANKKGLVPRLDVCKADSPSYKTAVRDIEEVNENMRLQKLKEARQ